MCPFFFHTSVKPDYTSVNMSYVQALRHYIIRLLFSVREPVKIKICPKNSSEKMYHKNSPKARSSPSISGSPKSKVSEKKKVPEIQDRNVNINKML